MPVKNSIIKDNVIIHEPVNIYNAYIEHNVSIGAFSEISGRIGANTRISAHCFIPKGVKIREYCFIGPRVTFCNVKRPKPRYSVDPSDYLHTQVGYGVVIGAGAVILPGLLLGSRCFIGAGAVVTKDVQPGTEVYGNPAIVTGTAISHNEVLKRENFPKVFNEDQSEYFRYNKYNFITL